MNVWYFERHGTNKYSRNSLEPENSVLRTKKRVKKTIFLMLSVFFRCRQKHRNNPKQKLDAEMFILFPSRFLRSVSPTTRSGYPFLFCLSRFRTLPAIECILLCEHLAKCHRTIYIIQVGYRASNFNEIWDSERNTKCILRTKKMSEVIGNSLHGHTIRIMRRKRCASVCRFFA